MRVAGAGERFSPLRMTSRMRARLLKTDAPSQDRDPARWSLVQLVVESLVSVESIAATAYAVSMGSMASGALATSTACPLRPRRQSRLHRPWMPRTPQTPWTLWAAGAMDAADATDAMDAMGSGRHGCRGCNGFCGRHGHSGRRGRHELHGPRRRSHKRDHTRAPGSRVRARACAPHQALRQPPLRPAPHAPQAGSRRGLLREVRREDAATSAPGRWARDSRSRGAQLSWLPRPRAFALGPESAKFGPNPKEELPSVATAGQIETGSRQLCGSGQVTFPGR